MGLFLTVVLLGILPCTTSLVGLGQVVSPRCLTMLNSKTAEVAAFQAAAAAAHVRCNNSIQSAEATKVLQLFFAPQFGAELFIVKNVTIAYALIFKVDSEGIGAAMYAADDVHRLQPDNGNYYQDRRYLTPTELQAAAVARFGVPLRPSRIFTFVRDPFSHFLSGLVEAHFRHLNVGDHPVHTAELQLLYDRNRVSVDGARHILDSIICATTSNNGPLSDRQHYSVQSHSIDYWRPQFVGRLEHREEDWAALNSFLRSNISSSVAHMPHDTSKDPMFLKASLTALFESDKRYVLAVCHLILADYVCLKSLYKLPPECAELAPHL